MVYMLIAYAIIWVALLAYSLTLSYRQKELSMEVERLEKAIVGGRGVTR